MDSVELFLVSLGASVVLFYALKLFSLLKILFPKTWYPLPRPFFTSLGEWAVITGGSEGIGRAYAFELAKHGLNVVIISRTMAKLEKTAKEIEDSTGRKVKIISADFTENDIYEHIERNLNGVNVAVLVNNVGVLPSRTPCRFLDIKDLEQSITRVINCNVKGLVKPLGLESPVTQTWKATVLVHRNMIIYKEECQKPSMCKIVLPGMEKRGKGLILNISSGVACVPCPLYTMYGATKVFVERFSRCLQAEYRSKGIIIQTVTPFGVSTPMTGYQKPNLITFTAEDFVRTSLNYVMAGDQTHGSITHQILGWIMQAIPIQILHSETIQERLLDYVNKRVNTNKLRPCAK